MTKPEEFKQKLDALLVDLKCQIHLNIPESGNIDIVISHEGGEILSIRQSFINNYKFAIGNEFVYNGKNEREG